MTIASFCTSANKLNDILLLFSSIATSLINVFILSILNDVFKKASGLDIKLNVYNTLNIFDVCFS